MPDQQGEFFTLEEQAQRRAVFRILDVKYSSAEPPETLMKIETSTASDGELTNEGVLIIGRLAAGELVGINQDTNPDEIKPANWREALLRADGFMSRYERGIKSSIKVVNPRFMVDFINGMVDIANERGDYDAAEFLRTVGRSAITNMGYAQLGGVEDYGYPDERGTPYL